VDGACLKGILACGLVAAVLATTCGNDGGAQADATDPGAEAGDVEVVSASGCVDFASIGPASTDSVDVTVHVSGTPLTGSIIASSL
jgi:hypothetical protein